MKKLSRIISALILPFCIGCVNFPQKSRNAEVVKADHFKYIPKGSYLVVFDVNFNGIAETFWWDSNYDGKIQKEVEIFIDYDENGIIDFTYKEFKDMLKYKPIHENIFSNESFI